MPSRSIEVIITGDAASLQRALGKSQKSLTGFAAKSEALGKRMEKTGKTLTTHLTLPLLGVGVVATKMAVDFGTAMNHVQALTGASQKQTKAWSDQVLKLAPKLGEAPTDFANALYFVASAGVKVSQVMPITTEAVKASAAGMGDAETVAQLLTSAINAYGAKSLSAKKATDILTESIKIGKAEPADFAENLGKVIPVAQAMGVKFAEVSGLTAELTNTGLNAAMATTGIRAALTGLLKPTGAAAKELAQVGLSVAGVQKEVREKGLLATLEDLKDRVNGNKSAMAKLFPNVRALTAFLALTGKNSKAAAQGVKQVTDSTGALNKAFATAQKGPAFQFHQALASLQVAAIRLGNVLIPFATELANKLAGLAKWFTGLSAGTKKFLAELATAGAILGPTLIIFGKLALALSRIRVLFGGTAVAAKAGGKAIAASGVEAEAASTAGFGPLGLAVGATALAVGGLILLTSNLGKGIDPLRDKFNHLNTALGKLPKALKDANKALHGFNTSQDKAGKAAKAADTATENYVKAVKKYGEESPQATKAQAAMAAAINKATKATKASDSATHKYGAATQQLTGPLKTAKTGLVGLTDSYGKHYSALQKSLSGERGFGGKTQALGSTVKTYAGRMDTLAGKYSALAGKLEESNPVLAANYKHLAAVARQAARTAQNINSIPTYKKILIDYETNREAASDPTASHNFGGKQVAGGGRGGHAIGGYIAPYGTSWVGERGKELIRAGKHGATVTPHGASLAAAMRTRTSIGATPTGRGMGGVVVNLTVTGPLMSGRQGARELARLLEPELNRIVKAR